MTVFAAVALAEDTENPDFRGHIDQARFFLRRGWTTDAAAELERAVATPDGALDPEAWFLLAQVRYDLADLHRARLAADRALVHSRDAATAERTRELLMFIREKFGFVLLRGPADATASRVDVTLTSTLFDPDLRTFTARLQERLSEEPAVLPTQLGLPAGAWTINGQPVVVAAGEQVELTVPLLGTRASTLQTLQVEVGLGASMWFGPRAVHLTPAPAAQLAISAPIGPVVAGLVADWAPASFEAADGARVLDAAGMLVGARVGVEAPNTAPLVLRPSLGWRVGRLPGIEVGCSTEGTQARCGDGAELFVVGAGLAHVPFAELALYYQDRKRRSSWGAGVKVFGELAIARLPAETDAVSADGATYAVTHTARQWVAPGIRGLFELSFAF